MLPERKLTRDPDAAAADVHPDYRTRRQHLHIITFLKKTQGQEKAMLYWLNHAPRISRKAFNEA